MSEIYDLIAGAFAGQKAPFAIHPSDTKRAAKYLNAAIEKGVTWNEATEDIRKYLTEQGCSEDYIENEINRAAPFFRPWIDNTWSP